MISLTAAYRYEPDPTKKFLITVRYVDREGNQIKAPESRTLPVESGLCWLEPAAINSYLIASAELTDGGITDLEDRCYIRAEDAGEPQYFQLSIYGKDAEPGHNIYLSI
ncbi:MAG: hypothetical protein ACLTW9_26660 [Enterocloster sp.]